MTYFWVDVHSFALLKWRKKERKLLGETFSEGLSSLSTKGFWGPVEWFHHMCEYCNHTGGSFVRVFTTLLIVYNRMWVFTSFSCRVAIGWEDCTQWALSQYLLYIHIQNPRTYHWDMTSYTAWCVCVRAYERKMSLVSPYLVYLNCRDNMIRIS